MLKNFKSLSKSFKDAIKGVVYCINTQRNMRIHLLAAVTVMLIAPVFSLRVAELAILILVIGLVIIAEVFNTSLEKVMDRITERYDRAIKIAKDIAAGAVFVAAVVAVLIGGLLFLQPLRIAYVFQVVIPTFGVFHYLGFLLYVVLGWLFVFRWPYKGKK